MKKLKRMMVFLLCAGMLFAFVGCREQQNENTTPTESTAEETQPTQETTEPDDGVEGRTVYWLGDYDLNPAKGKGRSAAIAMFETLYGANVEWIPCDYNDRYTVLSSRLQAGEPVDMMEFDVNAMPDGVQQGLFAPLDGYIDFKDVIWKDCLDEIDLFSWQGSHYVVPYAVSDTLLLAYSRKVCEENELADPYTLYTEGKWDWDAFMGMMQDFLAKNESRTKRYGIAGS
ncbi:MAG: extracellular solute-binding protein, partial [Oscillospiraceae bacterium]|nr:extracellular solute-binding protein [Oscillospiraceae bacterium]